MQEYFNNVGFLVSNGIVLQLQKRNAAKYLLAQMMVVLLVLVLEFGMVVMWGLQWELELVLQRVLMKAFLQNVHRQNCKNEGQYLQLYFCWI